MNILQQLQAANAVHSPHSKTAKTHGGGWCFENSNRQRVRAWIHDLPVGSQFDANKVAAANDITREQANVILQDLFRKAERNIERVRHPEKKSLSGWRKTHEVQS